MNFRPSGVLSSFKAMAKFWIVLNFPLVLFSRVLVVETACQGECLFYKIYTHNLKLKLSTHTDIIVSFNYDVPFYSIKDHLL